MGIKGIENSKKGYRKLIVWEKFKELLIVTYELTKHLPDTEKYGLVSQMRRAVVSVMSNFVEGYLKSSKKEKLRFLEISETSLMELEAQAEICLILNYLNEADYNRFEKSRSLAGYFLFRYKNRIKNP